MLRGIRRIVKRKTNSSNNSQNVIIKSNRIFVFLLFVQQQGNNGAPSFRLRVTFWGQLVIIHSAEQIYNFFNDIKYSKYIIYIRTY
jgi:hypothetical protein